MATSDHVPSSTPAYFRQPPVLIDSLETETSNLQRDTVKECLPFLAGVDDPARNPFDFNKFGVPRLEREDHINFLHENLDEFPAPFVGIDASRPWMVYWGLLSLYILGDDISLFRSRYQIPRNILLPLDP